MSDLIFKEEAYKIIGCCFEVHNELGHGFLEAVYQEALSIEFTKQNIPFVQFSEMNVFYKDIELKKKYYPDFLCFSNIIVEIKAMEALSPADEAQILNYLKGTKKPLGLLVNFGGEKLQYKRYANTRTANSCE
ncbi:MAG: GxxExxY protein [Candidatus Lokiarchaeota archaeon]|nr:GxxExxY protein [Candidatus Lokiarchaeota archaeon]